MDLSPVLLVGAGPMALEYAKVLQALGIRPIVVGRGKTSAQKFHAETQLPVTEGGIASWIANHKGPIPSKAIVAVGEKWIGSAAQNLLDHGVKTLLLEKTGGFDAEDIRAVEKKALHHNATVYVGYNRRFYSSVTKAKTILAQDGGVTSFQFEFTEWSHVITPLEKEPGVKEQWFLSNSSHVIDLAFFLGGAPETMVSYTSGSLPWHPFGSVFVGAGHSVNGALFSYQANWEAPGRWGVECLTRQHRVILRPLEKLQIQKIGSVAVETVDIDDTLDTGFKPGLYRQTEAFLSNAADVLPTLSQQTAMLDWYLKIRAGETSGAKN